MSSADSLPGVEAPGVLDTAPQILGASAVAPSPSRPTPWTFQVRVLKALVLRDMTATYGQFRLGYLLGLILPVLTIALLMVFFKLRGRVAPSNLGFGVFIVTGYPVWFAFIGMYSNVMNSATKSDPLLMFPQITQLDLILSTAILRFATNTVVYTIICMGVFVAGWAKFPHDPVAVMLCYWSVLWIGASVGLVASAGQRIFPLLSNFLSPFMRVGMWISGVVFTIDRLPTSVWPYLSWNPILHAVEMAREDWSGVYVSPIASPVYILSCAFVLTTVGFVTERASRRFVGE